MKINRLLKLLWLIVVTVMLIKLIPGYLEVPNMAIGLSIIGTVTLFLLMVSGALSLFGHVVYYIYIWLFDSNDNSPGIVHTTHSIFRVIMFPYTIGFIVSDMVGTNENK